MSAHLREVWRRVAMPDSEGFWYHTGDGSPLHYQGDAWVHLGTRKAAESRRGAWNSRELYRSEDQPSRPLQLSVFPG